MAQEQTKRRLAASLVADVVGYTRMMAADEAARSARGLYLSNLYVTPGARRRGIARPLMTELARRAAAEGGAFVWWIVTPNHRGAEALDAPVGARREPVAAMAVHGDAVAALAARR